jgi:hypothetical protein
MNELPTMRDPQAKPADVAENETVTSPIVPYFESISITIPFIAESTMTSFQDEANRVDMGNLTRDRMRKVKALRRGLVASDVRLAGGAEVRTNRDAIFCLLDMLDI